MAAGSAKRIAIARKPAWKNFHVAVPSRVSTMRLAAKPWDPVLFRKTVQTDLFRHPAKLRRVLHNT